MERLGCCSFAADASTVAAAATSTANLEELRCWVLGKWPQAERAEKAAAAAVPAGGSHWSEPSRSGLVPALIPHVWMHLFQLGSHPCCPCFNGALLLGEKSLHTLLQPLHALNLL